MFPIFTIGQRESNAKILQIVRDTLRCGYFRTSENNHRKDGYKRERTVTLRTSSLKDCIIKIIPFMDKYLIHKTRRYTLWRTAVFHMRDGCNRKSVIDKVLELKMLIDNTNPIAEEKRRGEYFF